MAQIEAKVYFDGSHYIAIPKSDSVQGKKSERFYSMENKDKKAVFENAYKNVKARKRKDKVKEIINEIKSEFESEEKATNFVIENMQRLNRNLIVRRMRLARKINWGKWDYFCTFTYDDKKHTKESFRKRLSDCFKKMSYRHDWVYIGVWERSPKNQRLHFHGIFNIPKMKGELIEVRDYDTRAHKMRTTLQNTYFSERFGRNDFSPIDPYNLGNATAYLMKYIGKSGERIVYSKNTPTYFISDILEDDVVCTIGQEDRKLLLFDDFSCFDRGSYIGKVNPDVIKQMRKAN